MTRVITVAARPLRAARSLHMRTKCVLTRIYLRVERTAPGCTAGAAEDSKTITLAKGSKRADQARSYGGVNSDEQE